ncbi:hypothetical protein [Cryobacterium soli]|uniref:hypothetical protein n=1 Tax=Cryobacterium soli TaxID=2220095 RepID=UPI000E76F476|nr:hypothetical protein [Cryobacterium soli]
MTVVTITGADIVSLGGSLPLSGFIDVWRLTPLSGQLDKSKVGSQPLSAGSITIDSAPAGGAVLLFPRGVRNLFESWAVIPPAGTISLTDLLAAHQVDVKTLLPLTEVPPSVADILEQVTVAGEAVVQSASAASQSATDAAAARLGAEAAAAGVPTPAELTATFVPIVKAAVLTRDGAGRIASAVENGVTVTYTRDSAGRIATETRSGKVTTYTRDASGRVSGWATV